MKSMTGYGHSSADVSEKHLRIEIEITSVNRKTLDAFINSPKEWNGLEARCNEWIKDSFQRGRVNAQIKVESLEGPQNGLTWDSASLNDSILRLKKFAEAHNYPFEVDTHLILETAKTIKDTGSLPDWQSLEADIEACFKLSLEDIDQMRINEGSALAKDLSTRIGILEKNTALIASHAVDSVSLYRDALFERLKQLNLDLDLSDERVLKEIALFADRCDVSEEMTRLYSHFEQFHQFIASTEPTGRKMDFLCQEIHRELNTTGSKSSQIEITRAVIESKNELERIREQVQNVE
jgi:uncharacterized protein (TIGR00255 family)